MKDTNSRSTLYQQDWLGHHEPKKRSVLLAMTITTLLILMMVRDLPALIEVWFVYQTGIMVMIFAYFFSYIKIWKKAHKCLPMLTADEHQLMFAYTTRCYSIRAFLFSIFWPAFFLPRFSKKSEYCR
ncbi:hypothetical protein H6769_03880 [Candidatus Peribacteria bacterium]|nr:hypothetical protein [Candidatus Peribacteria bacterium]